MTQADDEAWKREEQHYEIMQDQLRDKKKIEKVNALISSIQDPKKHTTYEVEETSND